MPRSAEEKLDEIERLIKNRVVDYQLIDHMILNDNLKQVSERFQKVYAQMLDLDIEHEVAIDRRLFARISFPALIAYFAGKGDAPLAYRQYIDEFNRTSDRVFADVSFKNISNITREQYIMIDRYTQKIARYIEKSDMHKAAAVLSALSKLLYDEADNLKEINLSARAASILEQYIPLITKAKRNIWSELRKLTQTQSKPIPFLHPYKFILEQGLENKKLSMDAMRICRPYMEEFNTISKLNPEFQKYAILDFYEKMLNTDEKICSLLVSKEIIKVLTKGDSQRYTVDVMNLGTFVRALAPDERIAKIIEKLIQNPLLCLSLLKNNHIGLDNFKFEHLPDPLLNAEQETNELMKDEQKQFNDLLEKPALFAKECFMPSPVAIETMIILYELQQTHDELLDNTLEQIQMQTSELSCQEKLLLLPAKYLIFTFKFSVNSTELRNWLTQLEIASAPGKAESHYLDDIRKCIIQIAKDQKIVLDTAKIEQTESAEQLLGLLIDFSTFSSIPRKTIARIFVDCFKKLQANEQRFIFLKYPKYIDHIAQHDIKLLDNIYEQIAKIFVQTRGDANQQAFINQLATDCAGDINSAFAKYQSDHVKPCSKQQIIEINKLLSPPNTPTTSPPKPRQRRLSIASLRLPESPISSLVSSGRTSPPASPSSSPPASPKEVVKRETTGTLRRFFSRSRSRSIVRFDTVQSSATLLTAKPVVPHKKGMEKVQSIPLIPRPANADVIEPSAHAPEVQPQIQQARARAATSAEPVKQQGNWDFSLPLDHQAQQSNVLQALLSPRTEVVKPLIPIPQNSALPAEAENRTTEALMSPRVKLDEVTQCQQFSTPRRRHKKPTGPIILATRVVFEAIEPDTNTETDAAVNTASACSSSTSSATPTPRLDEITTSTASSITVQNENGIPVLQYGLFHLQLNLTPSENKRSPRDISKSPRLVEEFKRSPRTGESSLATLSRTSPLQSPSRRSTVLNSAITENLEHKPSAIARVNMARLHHKRQISLQLSSSSFFDESLGSPLRVAKSDTSVPETKTVLPPTKSLG